jgi:hypothetical protein
MTTRYEDLTDTELRTLSDDLNDRIDALDNEGDGAPDDLLERWAQADREQSRRDAIAARREGRYSATLNIGGETYEYELKATTEADAQVEAESGVEAMVKLGRGTVTIERLNAPITE